MALKIKSTNIDSATLNSLTVPKITSLTYPNSANAANPAGGETITVTGTGFSSGITVYIDSTSCSTTYVSTTSLTFTSPAKSAASYNIIVYNTDGGSAIKPNGILYSAVPVWVTAAGALTSAYQNSSYSQSVSATGDTIVYSLTSGSLPTGLSLNTSTGAITGTAPNTLGTSTFTITATDAQNQGVARSFSIEVTVPLISTVDYLVVAGGGGAGYSSSSGAGGGGGLRTATDFSITTGVAITVTVGAGGAGGTGSNGAGSKGGDSSFSTITSTGGGYGAYDNFAGGAGGSGGGGGLGNFNPSSAGGAGNTPATTPSQGNNGGTSQGNGSNKFSGGGGGGAGAVGQTLDVSTGTRTASGGAGASSDYSGTSTYYAGGGGAGKDNRATALTSGAGLGGIGGGGDGVASSATPGVSGTVNTGGGGGGGCYDGAQSNGGTGGSGVVIIRYSNVFANAVSTTGSPTYTNTGGYKIYKFTASGSITF